MNKWELLGTAIVFIVSMAAMAFTKGEYDD